MKKSVLTFVFLFILCAVAIAQPKHPSEKVLRHVVIFKFKESSSAEDVEKVAQAFANLKKQIKVVKAFEWGINSSPEHFDQGFTHCFVLTFANEHDRDVVYQKHPAHQAFQEILKPHMDKVFVVDYWTK